MTVCVPARLPDSAKLPAATRESRRRSLARLFRVVASTACIATLAACGGGGGTTTPAPPPPPPPPPSSGPLDAQFTVPTPVGYDADRLAAFNRLNEIRLSAGLGMLAQQPLMDQAAQAHADWEIANDTDGHEEVPGSPGFTGVDWGLRDEALGYIPLGGAEVISSGYGASAGVDALVNVAYHREVILAFEPVDVGIGRSALSRANVSQPLVIDISMPGGDPVRDRGQKAQPWTEGVAVWPRNGAQGVSMRMGPESPNPVPAVDVQTLGTPISVTVAASQTLVVNSFTLTKVSTGVQISLAILTNAVDTNGLIPPSYVVAIPLAPLDPNSSYSAAFIGTATESPFGSPSSLNRSWTFATGAL
ncbi:MAG: hypothetical protein ABJD97_10145 [Betaproteobacteria bacterium]